MFSILLTYFHWNTTAELELRFLNHETSRLDIILMKLTIEKFSWIIHTPNVDLQNSRKKKTNPKHLQPNWLGL